MSFGSISISTATSAALGQQLVPQRGATADPSNRQSQAVLPSQNAQAVVTQITSGPRTASSGNAKKVDSSFESEKSRTNESKEKKENAGKGHISVVA